MTLHADQAVRWTRAAQIGAAGAVGLIVLTVAGLVALLPEPEEAVAAVEPGPVEIAPPVPRPPAPQATHTDWREVAPLIAWVAPDPVRTVTEEGPGPGGGVIDAPPAADLINWRYLGIVREKNAVYALVAIEGKQRILWEGDKVAGAEIVGITPDRLKVKVNGVVQEIAIARSAEVTTFGPGALPRPRPAADAAQADLERLMREEAARSRERQNTDRRNRPQR